MASGELVGIINSDDWYEKDAVWNMIKAYESFKDSNPDMQMAVFYGTLCQWRDGKPVLTSKSDHTTLRSGMIAHPTCFVTMKTYEVYGTFNTKYISAADYDIMLRFYESENVHFEAVDALIANFALGGMCSSSKAYYDLLKVRRDHNLIGDWKYFTEYLKCKANDLIKGRK